MDDQQQAQAILGALKTMGRRQWRDLHSTDYESYCASHPEVPGLDILYRLFGSFQQALVLAGQPATSEEVVTGDRRSKALFDLKTVFSELVGSDLQPEEYEQYRRFSPPTMALTPVEEIIALYGSWQQAIIRAGLVA